MSQHMKTQRMAFAKMYRRGWKTKKLDRSIKTKKQKDAVKRAKQLSNLV